MISRSHLLGFFGSLLFHGAIAGVGVVIGIHNYGAYGTKTEEQTSHISMEMLRGMMVDTYQPTMPQEVETISAKEEVADPTVKKVEKKIQKKKPKKETVKKESKPKPKNKPKKQKTTLPNGDKNIDSKALTNAKASSNGSATTSDLAGQGAQLNAISAYQSSLRLSIEKNKVFPNRMKMMRKTGRVLVGFNVEASGELTNIHIVKSGGADFDRAAMAAVKNTRPIGVRPKGMTPKLEVSIKFDFK